MRKVSLGVSTLQGRLFDAFLANSARPEHSLRRETGSRKGCGNCALAPELQNHEKIAHFRVIFEQKRAKARSFGPVFNGFQLKVVSFGVVAFGSPCLRAIPTNAR
jgi:hypothetical protein